MQMRIVRPLTIVTLLLAAGMAPALAQQGPPPAGGAARARRHDRLCNSPARHSPMVGTIPDKYSCSPGWQNDLPEPAT